MKKLTVYILLLGLSSCQEKLSPELQMSMQRGQEVYQNFCVQCHLNEGQGVPNAFPPLAKSDYLATQTAATIAGLKYGMQGEIVVNGETYNGNMPAQGLEDDEIADVMNYIRNNWGNRNTTIILPKQVTQIPKTSP
ncbi:MAG: c-type cytochrome [Flavobacteriaceae bacterium]